MVFYGALSFDEASEDEIMEIQDKDIQKYDPNRDVEDREEKTYIQVFNATEYTTKRLGEKKDFVEINLALRRSDQQLSFIKVLVKSKLESESGEWECEYISKTHNIDREDQYKHEIFNVFNVNNGRNSFTFCLCSVGVWDKEIWNHNNAYNGEYYGEQMDEPGFLDVYMNGNRIITLDGVLNVGYDD